MIPRRVELENFLTYGTPAVSFEFTDDEPLWVIGGPNGSGKSAVFDAITFALFGVHRGGKTRVDELVHHGAEGLRVVFEFGFAGENYRITRATSKGKALAPKLDKHVAGAWSPESRISKVAELNAWVEEILGMDCEAFTSSVLLKQGEADKLFDAKREDRNAILKKIIGFEDYEELAGRVKEKAKEIKAEQARLKAALEAMNRVDDEALHAAQAETLRTCDALARAQESVDAAVQRIERAKQWRTLEAKRAAVQAQLDAAKDRAANADALRVKKGRFEELTAAVPLLKSITAAHAEIAKHASEIDSATAKLANATSTRDAAKAAAEQATKEMSEKQAALQTAGDRVKENARETVDANRLRSAAEDAESAARELAKFDATLTKDYDAAVVAEEKATKKQQEASKLHTEAETRFDSLKEQEKEFAKVKSGVKCSRCGQQVDKKHAEDEKKRIAAELADLEAAAKKTKKDLDAAMKALATAKTATGELAEKVKQRDAAAIRHEEKLKSLPEKMTVAELTTKLSALEAESTALAKTIADLKSAITSLKATAEREATRRDESAKEIETIAKALAKAKQMQAARQAVLENELPRLPRAWADQTVTLENLAALGEELKKLEAERVVEEYSKIVQDAAKLDEWRSQLATLQHEAEAIPSPDRLTTEAAEASREAAIANRSVAEAAQSAAKQSLARLEVQEQDYRRTSAELEIADRQHTLHKKLDELLGESGLLRDLLRDAEAEVIGIADNTLRQLTNQDLSLEIDPDVNPRQDKTFMLQVRKDGDPNPISLDFISGSQRFRVAVSLALAIGRFAAGKRRPIEAVIIDEGFGSLDEEGLRAMAENLQTLRRTQALKRIILVSHQKNFTDQFKAGYRLIPGPNGTRAERI